MVKLSDAAFIRDLLARMTLEEKIGQLTMTTSDFAVTGPGGAPISLEDVRQGRIGSVLNLYGPEWVCKTQRIAVEESRLKIPLFFGLDVLHGHRTVFPVPLAEAGAFDPDLWERTARAAAEEAAADGVDLTFAPMLDLSRDPRWGRIVEGPGEDPWLGQRFAEAKVRGFQRSKLDGKASIAATAKHLAAYGAVTAGREYAPVDISERQLHEVYLPPFRAAVEAGVAAIMPALTDLAGIPLTAHAAILRDLVRDRWGFSGVIITDYRAVAQLIAHGVAEDLADAAALALSAGVDIDMMGQAYAKGLPVAVERGSVSIAAVDAAVSRVLALKVELGLFRDPYRRVGGARPLGAPRARKAPGAKKRRLAREAACRSIVLLKNQDGLLPLRDDVGPVAVIGPLGDAKEEMLGPWSAAGVPAEVVSVIEGLRGAFSRGGVSFAPGCGIELADADALAAALGAARKAAVVVLCLGESRSMSGEASSRGRPSLPEAQAALARSLLALGKPLIVLLFSGRPLILPSWLVEKASALLAMWFLGTETGNAAADVLCGRWNPSGRLSISWPVDVGQIPISYDRRSTGRPADPKDHFTSKYLDLPVEPLFAFGHGLSYGQFQLSHLRTDRAKLAPGQSVAIKVDVANRGAAAGEETVLLFVHDPVASVARPLLELKAVRKITLAPGQRGRAQFSLSFDDFSFLGPDLSPRTEPGTIELLVGQSALRERMLKSTLRLVSTRSQPKAMTP
ncbi:MAG: beta-glucosidase BglX [Hyphomicrobiales bacterium]